MAPQVGLEPTTLWLTATCSANWAIEEYIKLKIKISVSLKLHTTFGDTAYEAYRMIYNKIY